MFRLAASSCTMEIRPLLLAFQLHFTALHICCQPTFSCSSGKHILILCLTSVFFLFSEIHIVLFSAYVYNVFFQACLTPAGGGQGEVFYTILCLGVHCLCGADAINIRCSSRIHPEASNCKRDCMNYTHHRIMRWLQCIKVALIKKEHLCFDTT